MCFYEEETFRVKNVESEDVDFFFSRSDEKGTNKVPKMRLSIGRRVARTRIYFLWQRDDEAKSARTCQKSVDEGVCSLLFALGQQALT